ncbi:MAG TPA: apolipoprotein N-acyltransferase [Terracidiphilus sp.]|nr:apolipoprotein N-acyltransferase [Terracidiphilus sp.]
MHRHAWRHWGAASLSAGLLELPFPLAGPLPPWRSAFAWFALAPLLWAVLCPATIEASRSFRRAFLLSYLAGFLWYMGNCYWVRDTMSRYGDMPTMAPTLLLVAFSLVLGLYFGFFGLGVALVRKATGSVALALAAAPFLWTGLDLAAARITSVPWDQLGYSQVDNSAVNQLAPWAGVYGITFVLVAANALLASAFLLRARTVRLRCGLAGGVIVIGGACGFLILPPRPAGTATAVLVQPNLDVGTESNWSGPGEWEGHMAQFTQLAGEQCKTYIAGIPQTNAPAGEVVCPPYPTRPDLVAWPESPAPFIEADPRFQQSAATLAQAVGAPLVIGGIGAEYSDVEQAWHDFNSAMVFGPDGSRQGRYNKIHLVPFGEYIPFKNLLVFARKLTGRVSEFSRGTDRHVFLLPTQSGARHRYGFFICYEAVFADEVRHLAGNGAEVLVNISDDGWYGDTSAPWQHLNMARMRAIENRRWLLRDTNNGITAAIDPYGRVRQSIPRHQTDALPAQYGFRDDITFYSAHGDVFAWCCAILSIGVAAWSVKRLSRTTADANVHIKVRS